MIIYESIAPNNRLVHETIKFRHIFGDLEMVIGDKSKTLQHSLPHLCAASPAVSPHSLVKAVR